MSLLNNTNIYIRTVQRPGLFSDLVQIQLNPAEIAYTTDTDRLYIGNIANKPVPVGLKHAGEYSFGSDGKPTFDYSSRIEDRDFIYDTTNSLLRRYNKVNDTFVVIASNSQTAINNVSSDLSSNYYTKVQVDALLTSLSSNSSSALAAGLATCIRNNVGTNQNMIGPITVPGITSSGGFTFALTAQPPRNQNTINNIGNAGQFNAEGNRWITNGSTPSSSANGDIWLSV